MRVWKKERKKHFVKQWKTMSWITREISVICKLEIIQMYLNQAYLYSSTRRICATTKSYRHPSKSSKEQKQSMIYKMFPLYILHFKPYMRAVIPVVMIKGVSATFICFSYVSTHLVCVLTFTFATIWTKRNNMLFVCLCWTIKCKRDFYEITSAPSRLWEGHSCCSSTKTRTDPRLSGTST